MNKIQFNELINYLKNRPSEAARLRMLLTGESELQADPQQQNLRQADQWLTAKEVGLRIGQSGKWVKERVAQFPLDTIERRGNRGTWYFNYTRIENQLQQMRG